MNTVNGASLSNEREGYMRKRMLLFNDIILICKAHKGKKNECGQEEFDDTSIEGVNELELVLDMEGVKLNHVILGKTGETLESFARDLLKGDAHGEHEEKMECSRGRCSTPKMTRSVETRPWN